MRPAALMLIANARVYIFTRKYRCICACVCVCMYVHVYIYNKGPQNHRPAAPMVIGNVCNEKMLKCSSFCASHCNTLQHTATHCITPHHTARYRTHCNTLQHTAAHCSTLQHTATHCNTLQHTATHCNTLQHTTSHCKIQNTTHRSKHYHVPRIFAQRRPW